jgi:non-specific serine/threonine protein kinase
MPAPQHAKVDQLRAEVTGAGMADPRFADRLVVSQRTVESHVEHILAKFTFASRTQIAAWYTRRQGGQLPSAPPTG